MGFIMLCHDTVILVEAEATPELLEKGVYGPPHGVALQGPSPVRAYWDDESFLKRRAPNVEATLLLRKHGGIPPHGVVFGMVALVASTEDGSPAEIPDWVRETLAEVGPLAEQIDRACRPKD